MKYKLLSILLLATAALCQGCVEDEVEEPWAPEPGQSGESRFQIAVDSFKVTGTRASEPSENPEPESADEKRIDNFWLFQFNPDGSQLAAPKYYELTAETPTLDGLTDLAYADLERDKPMTIYVVTNVGSSTWATGEGFGTLESVKAQKLPTPAPIQAGVNDILIPMSGQVDNITVTDTDKTFVVVVPVTRMYAKLKIQASFSVSDMLIYDVNITGIPWYCKVAPMDNGLDANGEPAAVPFPEKTTMISRAFQSIEAVTDESGEEWLILYMPENIRGEVADADKNKSQNIPENTLTISIRAKYDGMDYYFKVYPGENITNNFNVRRNCVYRVTVDVNSAEDQHNPSSNCFIVNPGDKLAFEPYNRVETAGGFHIEDYLTPDDESKRIDKVEIVWQTKDCIGDNTDGKLVYLGPETTPKKHRKIIVHTQKEGNALIAARNNKTGEIVWSWHIWVTPNKPDNLANAVVYTTYRWDMTKQTYKYVVKKPVYNSVWDEFMGNVDHWEYTYEYKEREGVLPIFNEPRIPGYSVMQCNLGALAFESDLADKTPSLTDNAKQIHGKPLSAGEKATYGMVYQWGRKDPFPPVVCRTAGTGDQVGRTQYGNFETYPMGFLDYTEEFADTHYKNNNKDVAYKTHEFAGADSKYTFYSELNDNTGSNVSEGLKYAIAHPTVYIASVTEEANEDIINPGWGVGEYVGEGGQTYLNDGDWLPKGHNEELWGGLNPSEATKTLELTYTENEKTYHGALYDNYGPEKSVFDPCPTGWRVAPADLWLGFTDTGLDPEDKDYDDRDMAQVNWNKDKSGELGMCMYMQDWRRGPTSYFPLQGTRAKLGRGLSVGWCGNYHNATCGLDNGVNVLHLHQNSLRFHIFEYILNRYYVKSVAGPVRCVRDQK